GGGAGRRRADLLPALRRGPRAARGPGDGGGGLRGAAGRRRRRPGRAQPVAERLPGAGRLRVRHPLQRPGRAPDRLRHPGGVHGGRAGGRVREVGGRRCGPGRGDVLHTPERQEGHEDRAWAAAKLKASTPFLMMVVVVSIIYY
ncbi:unnamed protein product, partial [Heterosigma akashiwo]